MVIAQVTRARNYTDDVEWSSEDGTRTEHDFLCRCVEAAIKAGATTINIPDTVGYTVPEEYFALIKMVRERVPNSDKARFSVHCHDDLGMAVANSLAGVRAGARQIECTINGIGERAGNAALEEVVMAMKVRNDVLPYWTNIDTTMLTRASKLVSAATSFPVQYNKAIVGRNAFAHESGIHQDGMLKHTQTYEIMTPESVGVKQTSLVMGKHSGRHAFVHKLEGAGLQARRQPARGRLRALQGAGRPQEAGLRRGHRGAGRRGDRARAGPHQAGLADGDRRHHGAAIGDHDARHRRHASDRAVDGNGPVDATFNCIKALVPHEATLELYQVHAVTEGTDAQAEVSVRLSENGTVGDRQGRRSRHAGRLRQGLSRRAQQADDQAPARRGRVAGAPPAFDRRGVSVRATNRTHVSFRTSGDERHRDCTSRRSCHRPRALPAPRNGRESIQRDDAVPPTPDYDRHPEVPACNAGLEGCTAPGRRPSRLASLAPQG